ncbi:unnamed protein product [Somion occarium]|uniref:BRO1 domain-containing protein n=1 Tax=Somion occarium TaxID=3059160 RepID=A0ABP1EAQ3_9APHY
MSNQLSIPFKKTRSIPIRQAVKDYILSAHPDTHPDAFKNDITEWEALRKDCIGGVVHPDRIQSAIKYHAQLVFILTKLPSDIGLEVPYCPVFNESSQPYALRSLAYERSAVLFNLAALQSQLALDEDRSSPQGLKKAIAYYQNAAGTLNYLNSTALPNLRVLADLDTLPLELSDPVISHLELLMLAQAQECVWQRAYLDGLKHALLAKLSMKVASLYEEALATIRERPPSLRNIFPTGWLYHVEAKRFHFEAAAHLRKSMDDSDAKRYGHEVARLSAAHAAVKQSYDAARRIGVSKLVMHDAKSLLDVVQKELARAERDNDLIYHHEVPALSALPPITEVSMVQSLVSTSLLEPKTVISHGEALFKELLAWGAKTAIRIYNERRDDLIKGEVREWAQRSNDAAIATLRSLNLPAALEALEKPIGLPPSLLKKAEEVRAENGPAQVESSIEDVRNLAERAMQILNEAEEDEAFRKEGPFDRLSSQEANRELAVKGERYRDILTHAAESDAVVREGWEEWENNILELTWDEADLEASVPSSTLSGHSRLSSRSPNLTQTHARALRVLLENLDNVQRARNETVARAQRLAEADDITLRISKAASAFEQWVAVKPEMLEDILDEELSKYEKFRTMLEQSEQKQQELLDAIKDRNILFLQSRKDDPIVKEREHALQSLDLAYHKYKEIIRNLDEGLKFYNDFGNMMVQFKEACKVWANARRNEMMALTRAMNAVTLEPAPIRSREAPSNLTSSRSTPVSPPPPATPRSRGIVVDLPPPDSADWEATQLPPAPMMPAKKSKTPKRTS